MSAGRNFRSLHSTTRVSMKIQMRRKRYERSRRRSGEGSGEEKGVDDVAQRVEALGGVDCGPEVRTVFKALGVPGSERPNLVDHPSIVTDGRGAAGRAGPRTALRRSMPETVRLVHAL